MDRATFRGVNKSYNFLQKADLTSVISIRARRQTKKNGRGPEPCRITNTGEEIWKAAGIDIAQEEETVEFTEYQVFDPDKGPLEKRGFKYYLDALVDDEVNMEHTAYWFSTPNGGWNQTPIRLPAAQEAPLELPDPYHPGSDRMSINDLEDGMELYGEVTDIWLYHGAEIDFGAEYDGLVPISPEQWKGITGLLMPGEPVKIKIHKIRTPGLYRWPVQLELLDHEVSDAITHPEEYEPTINHEWAADQGWGIDEICEATGRTYEEMTYLLPEPDDTYAKDVKEAFGYDDPIEEDLRDSQLMDLMLDEKQAMEGLEGAGEILADF